MPARFEANIFSPDAVKVMKEAFEAAWPKVRPIEYDEALTRTLLASAIIDQVNDGVRAVSCPQHPARFPGPAAPASGAFFCRLSTRR